MTHAEILLDSVSPAGIRVTTLKIRFHRFILAELNTHRVLSRNAASSRAIPVKKTLSMVENDPAYPISWPREQKGMQGGEEIQGQELEEILGIWDQIRFFTIDKVQQLVDRGLHKSVANRRLEPDIWTEDIVTATDWINFFNLRANEQAQPEFRVLAFAMKEMIESSTPKQLYSGQWHMPYIRQEDLFLPLEVQKRISAARCARVSYLTHEGKRDVEADLTLAERLINSGHASPFEHVCTPADQYSPERKGNFRGWNQFRHDLFEDPE